LTHTVGAILPRFGDTVTGQEAWQFLPIQLSFNAIAPGDSFTNLIWQNLQSLGYPFVKYHDLALIHFDTVPECDRHTDGQTG